VLPLRDKTFPTDNRPVVYSAGLSIALAQPIRVFAAPPQAFREYEAAPAFLTMAFTRAIFNSSGQFLGMVVIPTSIAEMNEVLGKVDRSPNTHLFLVRSSYIHGTTYPSPVARIFTQPGTAPVPNGCLSTATVTSDANPGIVCPAEADSYPYAPVAQFMSGDGPKVLVSNEKLLTPGGTYLEFLTVPGFKLEVALAVTRIESEAKLLNLNLLTFVDMADVEGDLRTGIETAIGITCGIVALGVALIVVMLFIVLKPLEQVAKDMDDTAKLRFKEDDDMEPLIQQQQQDEGAGGDGEDGAMAVELSAVPSGSQTPGAAAVARSSSSGDYGGMVGARTESAGGDGAMGMHHQTSSGSYASRGNALAAQLGRPRVAAAAGATSGGGAGGAALSSITEIASLQTAFLGLSSALSSFTRYVPKEVVRGATTTFCARCSARRGRSTRASPSVVVITTTTIISISPARLARVAPRRSVRWSCLSPISSLSR
jgi:hypothetical protein